VGIALASEPSQLSQQIAYSPARGQLAFLPRDGIAVVNRGRRAVAAAVAVGIALASEPSQLSQQIAYSPARGLLASLPGDGIVVAVRAEFVVTA
jgi:hypothetical protein